MGEVSFILYGRKSATAELTRVYIYATLAAARTEADALVVKHGHYEAIVCNPKGGEAYRVCGSERRKAQRQVD